MKSRGLLLFALVAAPAFAQTDPVAAQALFDEAKRLMAKNNFDAACPKLAESERLDPAVGTQLNLAECWDKSGKTARAWAAFRDAEAMALHQGQASRAQYARLRAAQIETTLVRLTVEVPEDARAPSLEIRRDGDVLRDAVWGSALPVDPGDHVIEARAPGYKTFSTHVIAASGSIVVRIQPLEHVSDVTPTATTTTTTPEPPPPPVPTIDTTPPLTIDTARAEKPVVRDEPSTSGLRTAAFVTGGVGIAGVGVGALFGVLAIDRNNTARSAGCDDTTCPNMSALGVANDAKTLAIASDIAFVSGAVLVVTAVVLLAVAPRSPAAHVAASIARGGFSF